MFCLYHKLAKVLLCVSPSHWDLSWKSSLSLGHAFITDNGKKWENEWGLFKASMRERHMLLFLTIYWPKYMSKFDINGVGKYNLIIEMRCKYLSKLVTIIIATFLNMHREDTEKIFFSHYFSVVKWQGNQSVCPNI